jgi:hypothetical protein
MKMFGIFGLFEIIGLLQMGGFPELPFKNAIIVLV